MTEAIAGDVVAVLVDHHQRFLRFLESRVGSREAAEDVLQAAYVKGLERGRAIRDDESAVAWTHSQTAASISGSVVSVSSAPCRASARPSASRWR